MLNALKVRMSQGKQYIRDVRAAVPKGFRGRPLISNAACQASCSACADVCPTAAISLEPVRLDLGRCIFCSECAAACPASKIAFTPEVRMAGAAPESLVVGAAQSVPSPVAVSAELKKLFGRSLKLRSVSTGGCNSCELECNAMANVNFDFGRYGIDWVASPRHADALVLSGPLTRNMSEALELAWVGLPDPKFVIAFGACAISGGPYAGSEALERGFSERFRPQLYLPGCPPHPLTFLHGLLDLLGLEVEAKPREPAPAPSPGQKPAGVEPWVAPKG